MALFSPILAGLSLASWHSEAAAGNLIPHNLNAAVVDAGLERAHKLMGI